MNYRYIQGWKQPQKHYNATLVLLGFILVGAALGSLVG